MLLAQERIEPADPEPVEFSAPFTVDLRFKSPDKDTVVEGVTINSIRPPLPLLFPAASSPLVLSEPRASMRIFPASPALADVLIDEVPVMLPLAARLANSTVPPAPELLDTSIEP